MYLKVPFTIEKNGSIAKTNDVKSSIASFLELLVSCPQGACETEPDFGFVLKNYRFENVNEERGVLYSANANNIDNSIDYYSYKIHGRSNNGQKTFAMDLKKIIERYEPRLRQVKVNMEYRRLNKIVIITITGIVGDNIGEKFEHIIKIHVW